MSTVKKKLDYFKSLHRKLYPNDSSIALTKQIWDKWETPDNLRPNIEHAANQEVALDNNLFQEIVLVANRLAGKEFTAEYITLCFDDYNFHAYHAEDGYIVLSDDYFLQLLFILTTIITYDSVDEISEAEKESVVELVKGIVQNNYLNNRRFDFKKQVKIIELVGRDFEITEMAFCLFKAFKIFILAHEVGHFVLGHTVADKNKRIITYDDSVTLEVDNPEKKDEYEADQYGYVLLKKILEISDQPIPEINIKEALCKYSFDYAPLLLFELFEKLDHRMEGRRGKPIEYFTHPKPRERYNALIKTNNIDISSDLYRDLKKAIDII